MCRETLKKMMLKEEQHGSLLSVFGGVRDSVGLVFLTF
jgi:hypothetical protein